MIALLLCCDSCSLYAIEQFVILFDGGIATFAALTNGIKALAVPALFIGLIFPGSDLWMHFAPPVGGLKRYPGLFANNLHVFARSLSLFLACTLNLFIV